MKAAVFAGIVIALLVGFVVVREWPRKQNVRLTLRIQTPEGLRTGTSVVELSKKSFAVPASSGATAKTAVIGEAVVVELPNAPSLFMLVGDADGLPLPTMLRAARLMEGERVEVTSNAQLLRFSNPKDVRSMELLSAAQVPAVYGAGFRVVSIEAEPTAEAVTTGIADRLPSFASLRAWRATLPANDPRQRITRDQFIRRH